MAMNLLDEKVRNRLRSGVAITSMAQCVGELVENSIDAGAKCIAVRVDISKYKIQVIDNGTGLMKQDMELIGQRYATSKCHTLTDLDHHLQHLGYRGEALASIINCTGTVEICSRHCLSQQTYSKIFYHGKPTSITPSSNPRPSVGTTVTIHDFFYNLPVRRKAISEVLEMENLRHIIQCLALVNPSISFSLRNDFKGECIMQTRKTHSVLGSFSTLFGASKASGMKEVSLKHDTFNITGYLSTESHHNKWLQFIYVNRRIVKKTPLHSCINNMIANSLIVRNLSKQVESKWQNQDTDIVSPKRAAERHAIYVLMIECSRSEYDVCLEPCKTLIEFKNWTTLLDCLVQVVKQFLIQHNLTLGPGCVMEAEEDPSVTKESDDANDATEISTLQSSVVSEMHTTCFRLKCISQPVVELNEDQEDGSSDCEMATSSVHCRNGREYKERTSKYVNIPQRHISSLQLDKPIRSPLNSHSISSKLASLLQKDEKVSNSTFDNLEREQGTTIMELSRGKDTIVSNKEGITSVEAQRDNDDTLHTAVNQVLPHPLQPCIINPSCTVTEELMPANDFGCEQQEDMECIECQSNRNANHTSGADSLGIDSIQNDKGSGQKDLSILDTDDTSKLNGMYRTNSDLLRNNVNLKTIWKEKYDPITARKIYIHSRTGNSCTTKPSELMGHIDTMPAGVNGGRDVSTSYGAKPLSAAPHLSHDFECFLPGTKKLRIEQIPAATGQPTTVDDADDESSSMSREGGLFENLFKTWKNPAFLPGQENIVDITGRSSRGQIKVHNIINRYKFSKEMLNNVKILGQVDKKFIACILDSQNNGTHNLLVLFDQHAAHERVRLEAILDDLYESPSTSGTHPAIKSCIVHPPLLINLTTTEKKLAKLFQKQLETLGVSLKFDGDNSVGVASIPSVLIEREVNEVRRGRPSVALELVQEMIIKHLEVLQATSGGSSTTPSSLMSVLNSQACHSAIKFGDPLTESECTDLIHALAKCKLPFQCAHGRPSLVPILDLDSLSKKYPPQEHPRDLCKRLSSKLTLIADQ